MLKNTLIEKIYGLDQTGETEIALGYCTQIKNIRISDNYNAFQIPGYEQLNNALASPTRGIWKGTVDGTEYLLLVCNGNVYTVDAGVLTSIGTLTDAPTHVFGLNDKVYFQNGTEYKYWDGTTFGNVTDSRYAYEPLIATGTPPTGGGTSVEPINYLTGWKHQKFSGDASSTQYFLREDNISADILEIFVDGSGTSLIENTDFTVDRTNGIVTPTPATKFTIGTSNIDIYWNKADTAAQADITSCRKSMEFETRVHFWGGTRANIRFYSGLEDGNVTAEYITSETIVGSTEITDIKAQYTRQIISTRKGSFQSYYQDVSGIISFPVRNLNGVIGNNPFGQMQIIDNLPVSFFDGVYAWNSLEVEDERNADIISTKVTQTYETFVEDDLITLDDNSKKELWISYGKEVLVYNYRNKAWYFFEMADNITALELIDGEVVLGTDQGQLMQFGDDKLNFNGVAIEAEIYLNMYDFGKEWIRKYMNEIYISIQPEDTRVNIDAYYRTDRETEGAEVPINVSLGYAVLNFNQIDFNYFPFTSNTSPKPQKIKRTGAKKFTYFMLILKNSTLNAKMNVLSINYIANVGGRSD